MDTSQSNNETTLSPSEALFSMRIMSQFYGYPQLMSMTKEYYESQDKYDFLNRIPLDSNPEIERQLQLKPSVGELESIFNGLIECDLDLDFLISVSKLIRDEDHARLFEGMIYMQMEAKGNSNLEEDG